MATGASRLKSEVGEIDTSLPFHSVKDAVSLFGEGVFSGGNPTIRKTRARSVDMRALGSESQLLLTEKELNNLRDQLKNAENTKAQAQAELEDAKRTVGDLTHKLKSLGESKLSGIKAKEAAKNQTKHLQEAKLGGPAKNVAVVKENQDFASEQNIAVVADLNAEEKQELKLIGQDSDLSFQAEFSAPKEIGEDENDVKARENRAKEGVEEISALQESVEQQQPDSDSLQAQPEEAFVEKDIQRQQSKATLEELTNKVTSLKKEVHPELNRILEAQLAQTSNEIGLLRKEMENAKASELSSVTTELDDAKESLQKVAVEEASLRSLLDALKRELENVMKEHATLKEKEEETESEAGNLNAKLFRTKSILVERIPEESRAKESCDEMMSTFNQILSESETSHREGEEMQREAEQLKKEAEAAKVALQEAEKKLSLALDEAEEAKAAEKKALDQAMVLSTIINAARASTSESGTITISKEDFESLNQVAGDCDKLTEMKVAAATAQVKAAQASENEAVKKLEATLKELEDVRAATNEALKKAEMAEAARNAVEGELRRWRETEQKKAAENAALSSVETEKSSESHPQPSMLQQQSLPVKVVETGMVKKHKSASKIALVASLGGILKRKKNRVKGESPSYLPGEKAL